MTMPAVTETIATFPSVRLPSHSGGLPVEVALIAQLGIGAGDPLIHGVLARQRAHAAFVDALDEPSARIGAMDLAKGDATSLYTFAVGAAGHPFHRHAGHRVFTAVSGSDGARLRFSTASSAQLDRDPAQFVHALHHVDIPPDCLFTVRFGGGTWHQFAPRVAGSRHPALFALSCHTDELGGDLPADVRARVVDNAADIPMLTEVLPEAVLARLRVLDPATVPTTTLSLHEAPATPMARLCALTRPRIARLRAFVERWRHPGGFVMRAAPSLPVRELAAPPAGSLLLAELAAEHEHEDCFEVTLPPGDVATADAETLLANVLDGFLCNRPAGVTGLMALRNVLVKPLRLRTSPLGCPVSSLLSRTSPGVFAGRHPVLGQAVAPDRRRAEVILGADDRHLRFRSSVAVAITAAGVSVSMGTRVQPLNRFGRVYLAAIDRMHRRYVSPAMLRAAVGHVLATLPAGDGSRFRRGVWPEPVPSGSGGR